MGRAVAALASLALPVVIVGGAIVGCGSSDTFECGSGTCVTGAEVCVVGDDGACSTCIPAPDACSTCDCMPPATDDAFGDHRCVDAGTCQDVEGGAVVTCAEADDWGCG